jgi:hypothetical protein
MSTATNGAATEAAIRAASRAKNGAVSTVVDTATSVGKDDESRSDRAPRPGQAWLDATHAVAGLTLDAYQATLTAYLDISRSVAAGSVRWGLQLAEQGATILRGLASNHSTATRDLHAA